MTAEEKAKEVYEILAASRVAFRAVLASGGTENEAYLAANQAIQLWQNKNYKRD